MPLLKNNFLALIGLVFTVLAAAAASAAEPAHNEALHRFFQESFDKDVAESPIFQGYLGIKEDYDKWDDFSEEQAAKENARTEVELAYLREHFDYDSLSLADQESYRVFEVLSEKDLQSYLWRHHYYPLNQMFGWQSQVPSFLITVHRIDTKQDAENYIARLHGVKKLMGQIVEELRIRQEKGVIPPKFVFPHVISDIQNLMQGAPLDDSETDHVLLDDFKKKIDKLELADAEKQALIEQAKDALDTSFREGYETVLAFLEKQELQATHDAGVWKLPDGAAYYENRLYHHTSTGMTAEEIHELGLAEVARIHDEMRELIRKIGFEGDLQAFFEHSKTSEKFRYPETDEARADYLRVANAYLKGMEAKLPEAFNTLPKAPVEIRAVEKFREKSAGIGFYQPATPDGSRPGLFYVNLYKMESVPKTEIEALVYHETLPGHHMQISIAQELEAMPEFRKHANFTAYSEGWGLYSELLPKEMGFYQDPYSDFGRLTMELWRAIRLVVDTGIHAKRWTREQAIDYIMQNYPAEKSEAVKAAERYIVMPGQATAYKIGMLKILEAREAAKKALGDRFDIREFHDAVLKSGALPLSMMKANVENWVNVKKQP